MNSRVVVLLLVSIAIVGCANQPIYLDRVAVVPKLLPDDAVNVRINETEFTRMDDLVERPFDYHRNRVQTGSIWKRAFVGGSSAAADFRIKSAVIYQKNEVNGYAARLTYVVDGELSYAGKIHPIHAEATEISARYYKEAMRQAVERGIRDVAQQCFVIIFKEQLTH